MIAVRECFEQMYRGGHSNIHRTRHPGINCVFGSSLHSQVFLFSKKGPLYRLAEVLEWRA